MRNEMEKKHIWRIAALIAAAVLPVLIVTLGIFLIHSGLILNSLNVITFFLLPCLSFGICLLMIRSRRRLWLKWVVCILAIGLFIWFTGHLVLLGPYVQRKYWTGDDALTQYQTDWADGDSFFYTIPGMGQPESSEYQHYFKQIGAFFDTYAYTMICQYSESDYLSQKAFLSETYVFQTEPPSVPEYSIPAEYEKDGYLFRFLSFDEELYRLDFPKYMTILGFNDETCEIVYLYFDDDDLDFIRSWDEFLSDECGWNHIR